MVCTNILVLQQTYSYPVYFFVDIGKTYEIFKNFVSLILLFIRLN